MSPSFAVTTTSHSASSVCGLLSSQPANHIQRGGSTLLLPKPTTQPPAATAEQPHPHAVSATATPSPLPQPAPCFRPLMGSSGPPLGARASNGPPTGALGGSASTLPRTARSPAAGSCKPETESGCRVSKLLRPGGARLEAAEALWQLVAKGCSSPSL